MSFLNGDCLTLCSDPYIGNSYLTRSLLLDLIYVLYCAVTVILVTLSERSKPENSLVRPDKRYAPSYGAQGVPVIQMLSTIVCLLCLPEMVHTWSWLHSNPDLACNLQDHSLAVNIGATIPLFFIVLMNSAYLFRGRARTQLVAHLNLSAADHRICVWPTYRGFLLTEIAKTHKEKSASQPMQITPTPTPGRVSVSISKANATVSDLGGDERADNSAAESKHSSAAADLNGIDPSSLTAKQRKQLRPILGVDGFDPANIRAWARENCRREGVSNSCALRQFRPGPKAQFPVEHESIDFLFLSYPVSHPYLNNSRDTEILREQKRVALFADVIKCLKPGGRIAALSLSWTVEATEQLLKQSGMLHVETGPTSFWFSPFPSKLITCKKPLQSSQVLSDRSPIQPSPAVGRSPVSAGMAIPSRFVGGGSGRNSPLLGRTPQIGSYHENSGIMASSAISFGDHVPKPNTGAAAAAGTAATSGGLLRASIASTSNPDLSRMAGASDEAVRLTPTTAKPVASPAVGGSGRGDGDSNGYGSGSEDTKPPQLSDEFIRRCTTVVLVSFAILYGLNLFILGQFWCSFLIPTNIQWGNRLQSLVVSNVNSFWLGSWAAYGQLQSYLIHVQPTTNDAIWLVLKTIGTLILSLSVWNLVFWFPSFFLDILLYGKVSDNTLGYINIAFNIALFWGLSRGVPALWKYLKKKQAEAEAHEAAMNTKTVFHPLMVEIEREQSIVRNGSSSASASAAAPAPDGSLPIDGSANAGGDGRTPLLAAAH